LPKGPGQVRLFGARSRAFPTGRAVPGYVRHGEDVRDVDVYSGNLSGIAFAEVELQDEDQLFETPD